MFRVVFFLLFITSCARTVEKPSRDIASLKGLQKSCKQAFLQFVRPSKTSKIQAPIENIEERPLGSLSKEQFAEYGIKDMEEVIIEADGYVFEISGRIDGDAELEHLGTLSIEPSWDNQDKVIPGEIAVTSIEVEEHAWGRGLQNALFYKLFKENSDIKRIHTSLADVNADSFDDALYEVLDENEIDFFDFKNFSSSKQLEYLKEAISQTPAYKTRKRFGFEFCKGKSGIDYDSDTGLVMFDVCKK
jgi:hypothetical protein